MKNIILIVVLLFSFTLLFSEKYISYSETLVYNQSFSITVTCYDDENNNFFKYENHKDIKKHIIKTRYNNNWNVSVEIISELPEYLQKYEGIEISVKKYIYDKLNEEESYIKLKNNNWIYVYAKLK